MSAGLRVTLAGIVLAVGSPLFASASASAQGANACARHASEAARRSGLSVDVVLRVMHAESRGRPRAASPKGAMGCMQIMPGTWADLTRRHALGGDPFDPRMNMIGGALYLAELARQFGFPGAYSAYNAGPGRYQRHVRRGVPLPAETVAYTAQITGGAPMPARSAIAADKQTPQRWQDAALFIPVAPSRAPSSTAATNRADGDRDGDNPSAADALFPLVRPVVMAVSAQPEMPVESD